VNFKPYKKDQKKKQLALSLTSITFCTTIGARISRAPLMGDIGFRWLLDAADCIHFFPTRCHNRKPLLQRVRSYFKVQTPLLTSIAAAVTMLTNIYIQDLKLSLLRNNVEEGNILCEVTDHPVANPMVATQPLSRFNQAKLLDSQLGGIRNRVICHCTVQKPFCLFVIILHSAAGGHGISRTYILPASSVT